MTTDLEKQAEKLANRPYTVEYLEDETTDGERIMVASHPELPGCMGQGETFEVALLDLAAARKDYILSLLEDGLPVPQPSECKIGGATITSGTGSTWTLVDFVTQNETDEDDQVKPATISTVES